LNSVGGRADIRRDIRSVNTMPPRRHVETPVANRAMEREMRELCVSFDAMETAQRRVPDVGDVNEVENEEVVAEDVVEERMLRVVVKLGARAKIDIPYMYEGNLDTEELFNWIRAMEKYFDYEDVEKKKKVRHIVTRFKGHAALCWDELQADRRSKGK
jgi:putative transposon-encoded protein